jgi:hypothetical protein
MDLEAIQSSLEITSNVLVYEKTYLWSHAQAPLSSPSMILIDTNLDESKVAGMTPKKEKEYQR